MANDGWIGKKGIRYWYYRYRDSEYFSYALIGGIIIVCLFLLFNVIIPQLNSWFSIRAEVVATRDRIAVLERNINFMNALDKNALTTQLQTASSALPPEKDFVSMLDSLSEAAISSGITLNDFSFQVGNVASSSGSSTDPRYKDFASIKINVVAQGTLSNIKRFITTLENRLPLAEVVTLDGNNQTVSISVQYYQKSFPNIAISDDDPLKPVSAEKLGLLQKIASWKTVKPDQSQSTSGSSGAIPLF